MSHSLRGCSNCSILIKCDTAELLTGDTDWVPAVKTARRLFPKNQIAFLLPYKRHNKELAALADLHVNLSSQSYLKHQFSDLYICGNNKQIDKPLGW